MEDDVYRDMFIPKDSTIIINTMCVHVFYPPHGKHHAHSSEGVSDWTRKCIRTPIYSGRTDTFLKGAMSRFPQERSLDSGVGKLHIALDRHTSQMSLLLPRICPGRHLAEASLWIVITNFLATFNIDPLKDDNGRDIIPEPVFTNGFTRFASLLIIRDST